jgi:hypothetical protein
MRFTGPRKGMLGTLAVAVTGVTAGGAAMAVALVVTGHSTPEQLVLQDDPAAAQPASAGGANADPAPVAHVYRPATKAPAKTSTHRSTARVHHHTTVQAPAYSAPRAVVQQQQPAPPPVMSAGS